MESVQLNVTINSGNKLNPYEQYAIKTSDNALYIGYYSPTKNRFRSIDGESILLKNIVAFASIEELQSKMNQFGKA